MNATAMVVGIAAVLTVPGFGFVAVRAYATRRRRPPLAERVAAADRRVGLSVWDSPAQKWVHLPPGTEPGPGQLTSRALEEAGQLELLYAAPAYGEDPDTGCDRLRAAIDDQQEGDTP